MQRPFFHTPIEELETMVRANKHSLAVLGQVREELTFRETDRAKALLRDVMGLLTGQVPRPSRPAPVDSIENQLGLIPDAPSE